MDSRTSSTRFQELLRLSSSDFAALSPDGMLLERLEGFHREISGAPARDDGVGRALYELISLLRSTGRDQQILVRDFVLTENDWEMDWSYLQEEIEEVLFQLATLLPLQEHLNGDSDGFLEGMLGRLAGLLERR